MQKILVKVQHVVSMVMGLLYRHTIVIAHAWIVPDAKMNLCNVVGDMCWKQTHAQMKICVKYCVWIVKKYKGKKCPDTKLNLNTMEQI